MSQTWILKALTAGGTLTIKQIVKGRTILRAQMDWPGETPVVGEASLSLETSLGSLESALQEDCASQ
jgi:hypothetical protein